MPFPLSGFLCISVCLSFCSIVCLSVCVSSIYFCLLKALHSTDGWGAERASALLGLDSGGFRPAQSLVRVAKCRFDWLVCWGYLAECWLDPCVHEKTLGISQFCLWSEIAAPIKEGADCEQCGPECGSSQIAKISSDARTQLNTTLLRIETRTAYEATTYSDFWSSVETPHNRVHNALSCDMSSLETASYVPIFFLHHRFSNIQMLIQQRFQSFRQQCVSSTIPGHEVVLCKVGKKSIQGLRGKEGIPPPPAANYKQKKKVFLGQNRPKAVFFLGNLKILLSFLAKNSAMLRGAGVLTPAANEIFCG